MTTKWLTCNKKYQVYWKKLRLCRKAQNVGIASQQRKAKQVLTVEAVLTVRYLDKVGQPIKSYLSQSGALNKSSTYTGYSLPNEERCKYGFRTKFRVEKSNSLIIYNALLTRKIYWRIIACGVKTVQDGAKMHMTNPAELEISDKKSPMQNCAICSILITEATKMLPRTFFVGNWILCIIGPVIFCSISTR